MLSIFYLGDFKKGNGPSSVDISLMKELNEIKNINVFFFHIKNILTLSIFIKFLKSDVIHVSGVSFKGLIFFILAILFFKKKTFTMHGTLKFERKYRRVKKYRIIFESLLCCFSNVIIPVSNKLSKLLHNKKKIRVIPNGVDIKIYRPIAKKLNLVTLIGGGRKEKKNLDVCKLINEINHEFTAGVKVNLFGEVSDDSQEINAFDFVTDYGFVDKKIIYKSLNQSNIFIQFSDFESFSLSIADAINYQCKIIASDNVGINEYIGESDSYVVVKSNLELKNAILKLLKNDSLTEINHQLISWADVSKMYISMWCNNERY